MKLDLITLSGSKFSGAAYEVQLPTTTGPIAVFPGHEPLITLMKSGVIKVRKNKGDADAVIDIYATNGGVAEITPDGVKILVDEADHSEDISEEAAREALKHAEDLKANAKDSIELEKAQAMVDRYAVRIQVAGLRRRNRR